MKIAIMGAGALGCYFGGRILQAGGDVSFIARGDHLKALQDVGLAIESPLGDATIAPVTATADPADIGPVDMVMFLVKLYDTESAARAMAPLLGARTSVVTFQNGVDGWQRIGSIAGRDRVIGGTAYIPDDIDVRIWETFILLSAWSAITALTRLPIGPILADPLGANLFEAALRETHMVGMAHCTGLAADAGDRQLAVARAFPPKMRASMLDDLERGKRLELTDLSGAVVRLGEQAGIATPVHATVLAALHPYAGGRPG